MIARESRRRRRQCIHINCLFPTTAHQPPLCRSVLGLQGLLYGHDNPTFCSLASPLPDNDIMRPSFDRQYDDDYREEGEEGGDGADHAGRQAVMTIMTCETTMEAVVPHFRG